MLCDTVNLTQSDACDQFKPGTMVYNKPWLGSLVMEPRSTCGFYLNQYSAFLDISWKWPITLYHRDYKTVVPQDIDFLITESDPNGLFPGNACWTSDC